MSVDHYIQIPRARDSALVEFFTRVAELLGTDTITVQQFGAASGSPLNPSDDDEEYQLYAKSDAYLIRSISVSQNKFSVSLARDADGQLLIFDKIRFHNRQHDNPPVSSPFGSDVLAELNRLVGSSFLSSVEATAQIHTDAGTFRELMQSHQRMIEQMQRTVATVGEQVASARLRLEQEFAERRAELEAEFGQRQAQTEATMEELRQSVITREEQLTQRSKELDDRDHIHARRQLREQITESIASRLRGAIVPRGTSMVGWSVLALTLIGSAFLAAVSYFSLAEYAQIIDAANNAAGQRVQTREAIATSVLPGSTASWILLARGFLAGFGSIAFLVYAIGWLKSLYHDRLRAERELERYSIDLNRASWAVETIMESRSKEAVIPDLLVAGIAHNLFDAAPDRRPSEHSGDLSAMLLRSSAKAKIGPNGAEFELNGRGAKKLADQID